MQRFMGAAGLAILVGLLGSTSIRAADNDATAIIDKGIAALGGEAKLAKATSLKWKATGKLIIEGSENDFDTSYITQGIDHTRADFEGEFNGNEIKGSTVLDGDKGWRIFGESNALDADAIENEKRNLYLQVVPITLVPLKGKGFKTEASGEEKVGDKPANVVTVTGPDGKTFKLLFDKESGLPVKMIATVVGFGGDDYDQTTTYTEFKDFGGIKKATKVMLTRDGNPFLNVTVKEFQVVDQLPADAFAKPK